ncbi:MAG: hypothetical protein L3K17_05845 [Thermoplasmata archaeon]|nr:hypothetical protein [Thermoplasmata archaeon]
MHRVIPLLAAAALGVAAGALLGLYLLRGGVMTLTMVAVGMVLTSAAPVVLWTQEERSVRRHDETEGRRLQRQKYDRHAEELNDQVFRHLRDLKITSVVPVLASAGSTQSGLMVKSGDRAWAVEELPNWSYALEHLRDDAALAALYDAAESAVRSHQTVRDRTVETLSNRYAHLLLSRFGFDTPLKGSRFDAAPWYDVPSFVELALRAKGPIGRSELSIVPAMLTAQGASRSAVAHLVLAGEIALACVPDRDDADVVGLGALVEQGRSGEVASSAIRACGAAEQRAETAVRQLAGAARHYSDRILIEHTGSGTCHVCRPWMFG